MSEDENKQGKPDEIQDLILDLDFVPAWAKATPGVQADAGKESGKGRRSSSGGGGRDRDRRGGSDNRGRGDRRSGGGQDNRGGPRQGGRQGGEGHSGGRQGEGRSGGQGRSGGGQRGGGRGGRGGQHGRGGPGGPHKHRRRLPLRIDFIPQRDRLSKVVRIVRQSQRAFPMSDIAGRFMANPEFFQVKYTVNENKPEGKNFHLYQCQADHMAFTRIEDCEQHAITACLKKYFDTVEKPVDPPKGNFVCVGRCKMSGVLLGPPNHHAYAEALERNRLERYPNMPAEAYKSRVEIVHDAEVVEAWKQAQSTQVFYMEKVEDETAKPESDKQEPPAESAEAKGEEAPAKEESSALPATAEAGAEAPPAEESEAPAAGEGEDAAATEPEAAAEPEAAVEPESAAEPEAAAEPEDAAPEQAPREELTLKQAQSIVRRKFLPNQVKEQRRAIVGGAVAVVGGDQDLTGLTNDVLGRERQNPRSIVLALRPAFKHMHLHMFRAGGGTFVTAIKPQALDPEHVADEIREVLDYLSTHPGTKFPELLTALRPGEEEKSEAARHLASGLRWLVEKGHVIEFFDGSITVPKS